MTPPDPDPQIAHAGQMLRLPEEIARVLNSLVMRGQAIFSDLDGGRRPFQSRVRYVDPERTYIIIELSTDELANQALFARSRATFHAEPGGWRIEFAAADPQHTSPHEGAPGIKLRFPEIVSGHRRRADSRVEAPLKKELRVVIDEGGVMPFDGTMVNVSRGGIGFLQYDPTITLEPGTVLRGCRIDSADGESIVVDMEVRYSQLTDLGDERQVQSAGCRFLNLSDEDAARIEKMFDLKS